MEYKSDSDHETFWMVGEVYQCSRLAIHYQNGVCRTHRYPDVSLFSELFSLMHTSVLESVFFVDLVRDVARKCVEGGDFVGAYEKGGVLKEMNVWVFASLFPNLLDQFEDVAEKIMMVKVDKASICGELLERLGNDEKLFKIVRTLSGDRVSRRDFADVSIPYKVMNGLKGSDPPVFSGLSTSPLFCTTDEARVIDADWIWAYFALKFGIEAVDGAGDTMARGDQIDWCLAQVQNEEKRQSVIRDLFSLIFLKNNGRYLCRASTAEALLMLLMNMCDDRELIKYMRAGHQNLQVMKLLSDSDRLEDAMASKKAQLVTALINKDWFIAERIASLSPEDQEIMRLFKTVADQRQSVSEYIPKDGDIHIATEIALSCPQQKKAIEAAMNGANPSVLEILKKCGDKNRMSVIQERSLEFIHELTSKLTRLTASSWQVPSITGHKDLKLLTSFFEYLDSLLPLLFKVHPGQSLYDILAMNPRTVVDELLQTGQIHKAETMSGHLGMDVKEKILRDLNYPPEVIMKFAGDVPAIPFFASIIGNWPQFDCPNTTCSRIRAHRNFILGGENEPPTFTNLISKVEWFDMNHADGYTPEMAATDMESILKGRQTDIDDFVELSFRAHEDDIYRIVDECLSKDNIERMMEILERCPVSTDYLMQKRTMARLCQNGFNPFDRVACFRTLLNERRYEDAAAFYSTCHVEVFDEMLRNHCKDVGDVGALRVAPKMQHELWSIFAERVDAEATSDTRNDMPVHWQSDQGSKLEIIQRHMSEYHHVKEYLQKHPELNCDQVILSYAKENARQESSIPQKITVLGKVIQIYEKCIRKPELIFSVFQKELTCLLAGLIVESEDTEDTIFWCLSSVIPCLIRLYNKFTPSSPYLPHESRRTRRNETRRGSIKPSYSNGSLRRLSDKGRSQSDVPAGVIESPVQTKSPLDELLLTYNFISEFSFHRFGDRYSLCELGTTDFAKRMIDLCGKFDFHEFTREFGWVYQVSIDETVVSWIADSYEMSAFDESLPRYLKPLDELTKAELTKRDSLSEILEKECLLPPFIDPYIVETCQDFPPTSQTFALLCDTDTPFVESRNCKRSLTMENISFCHLYHRLVQLTRSPARPRPSKDQIRTITEFLDNYSPLCSKVFFFAKQLKWDSALEAASKINEQERLSVFQKIFEAALSSAQFVKFKEALVNLDPSHSIFSSCMRRISDDAAKRGLLHVQLVCQEYFGDNDLVATTAIAIFNQMKATPESLNYLAIAELAINEELANREKGKTNFAIPTETLHHDLDAIDLQRRFTMYCVENSLRAYDGLTLFDSQAKKEDIVLSLLTNGEFALSLEIMEKYKLRNRVIAVKITDSLFLADPNALFRLMKSLAKLATKDIYSEFVYTIVTRVWFEHMDRNLALRVLNDVKYPDIKCKLMIQLGFLDKAADLAIQHGLWDLLPLIAHVAQRNMNVPLVTRCVTALENR